MNDDKPYEVLGPERILLSQTAREWAREYGWSDTQMARHLLEQHQLREGGAIQRDREQ
jgi:hypothetical protein